MCIQYILTQTAEYIFLEQLIQISDFRHALRAARICEVEAGTMYQQLGEYVKQLALQLKA